MDATVSLAGGVASIGTILRGGMVTNLGSVVSTTADNNIYASHSQVVSNSWRSSLHSSAQRDGFIYSHISPRDPNIQIFANIIKVSTTSKIFGGGGQRGVIKGFSNASRKRMLEYLAKIRNFYRALFVTLTYPPVWSDDPEQWKRDIDTFLKRLYRLSPQCFAIWRLEPQERGAPHFHLLISNQPKTVRRFIQWVKLAWFMIVGSGDEKHLKAGTSVEKVYSRQHAMYYVSKYCAKFEREAYQFMSPDGAWITEVGKHWGIHNRKAADTSAYGEYRLTGKEMVELRRMMCRYLKSKGSRYAKRLAKAHPGVGWSIFGLGDAVTNVDQRTIYRMLNAVFDEEFQWNTYSA